MQRLYTLTSLVLILTTLLSVSCKSTEKRLLQGSYELAFDEAIDKLTRGKDKDKYALWAEDAFALAQERDLEEIAFLEAGGLDDRWLAIHDIYAAMKYRQDRLRPLLPLFIKEERRYADFTLLDLLDPLTEARTNAAAYLYDEAMQLLATGDKGDARDAYSVLSHLRSFAGDFRDSRDLMDEAHAVGTEWVVVEIRNHGANALSPGTMRDLQTADLRSLNSFWVEYLHFMPSGHEADYHAVVRLECAEASPAKHNELHYRESKEIKVSDDGRLVKDSTGNFIKLPVYETIHADVVEHKQQKAAKVSGRIEFFSAASPQPIRSVPVLAEVEFLNISAKATGDLDALKPETTEKLQGGVLPFPSDPAMIHDAALHFQGLMISALKEWEISGL